MTGSPFRLEAAIQTWRENLSGSAQFRAENLNELETHLRDSIGALRGKGLADEEAFLIAARRIGSAAALEPEFAKVNAREVWLGRAFWMLLGVQAWGLISGLANIVSRSVVTGGLLGCGYEFHRDNTSRLGVSVGLVILFAAANMFALALAFWACWRVTLRDRNKGVSAAVSSMVRRPGSLVVMVVGGWVLLLALNFFGYGEGSFFMNKLSLEAFSVLQVSKGYATWLLMPVQILAMLAVTAALARRLLSRKLQTR